MHYSVAARRIGLPTLLSLAIAASLSQLHFASAAQGVQAQNDAYPFSIPAQSLDGALAAFSRVTRIQVLVPGELTHDFLLAG